MRLTRWWVAAVLLTSLTLLSACQGQSQSATPTALPDPNVLLKEAAQQIREAQSLKFKLQLSGAPSYVDPPANTISFVSADGKYVAPDRVSASVVAKILGLAGEVQVAAIGDDQWFKNKVLTADQFVKQVFAPGFNAAKLISSDAGIASALKAIKDLKMVGLESLDGIPVYHLSGTADGKDIEALTVGLIRGAVVNADVFINRDNNRVERVVLVQPDTVTEKEPNPTRWDLELFDYNTKVTIEPPTVPAGSLSPTPSQAPTAEATPSS